MIIQTILQGISIGSVLLIVALGLAIVFGLMGVINLAHGELVMLGAYTTFVVQNIFRGFGDSLFDFYIIAAIPCAFIITALVGLILEKGVIRFLYGRPLETLLATWGVSLVLRQFVRSVNLSMTIAIVVFCLLFFGCMTYFSRQTHWEQIKTKFISIILPISGAIAIVAGILLNESENRALTNAWFGPRGVNVTAPSWLRGGIPIGDFPFPKDRIFIIVLTILCLLGIYLFLNKSDWGLKIRSVTQNRTMSSCLGIPTATVDALTFALGSGLAGIAGVGVSLLGSVGPETGQNYIVDAFMVVVVGGVGNLLGTIIAALSIGIISYLFESNTIGLLLMDQNLPEIVMETVNFFATSSMAKVLVFMLIIIFLQIKPAGIFPPKGRTAEL
ncbi:urea ABC transporter membrane protein [Cyanobacterium stanieri PCC 7202]|uniref:Urea ABC transporter membrane protein n=1 Tax=Cyanobacterium stanieri (strain ATCC 29140 / PCC 7202) TaxID=292563 RepID=K9YHT2_CYASC|nr:urea ABC transporter membrane protein [Cyanobacterium stanieri PCC 7202]